MMTAPHLLTVSGLEAHRRHFPDRRGDLIRRRVLSHPVNTWPPSPDREAVKLAAAIRRAERDRINAEHDALRRYQVERVRAVWEAMAGVYYGDFLPYLIDALQAYRAATDPDA